MENADEEDEWSGLMPHRGEPELDLSAWNAMNAAPAAAQPHPEPEPEPEPELGLEPEPKPWPVEPGPGPEVNSSEDELLPPRWFRSRRLRATIDNRLVAWSVYSLLLWFPAIEHALRWWFLDCGLIGQLQHAQYSQAIRSTALTVFYFAVAFAFHCLRQVIQPDGALENLARKGPEAEPVRITWAVDRTIRRWYRFCWLVAVFSIVVVNYSYISQFAYAVEDVWADSFLAAEGASNATAANGTAAQAEGSAETTSSECGEFDGDGGEALNFILTVASIFCESIQGVIFAIWFLSLQLGAVLADDGITDILRDLEGSHLYCDVEWQSKVRGPVRELAETTMPQLSKWGPSLGGIFVGCWARALSYVPGIVEKLGPAGDPSGALPLELLSATAFTGTSLLRDLQSKRLSCACRHGPGAMAWVVVRSRQQLLTLLRGRGADAHRARAGSDLERMRPDDRAAEPHAL